MPNFSRLSPPTHLSLMLLIALFGGVTYARAADTLVLHAIDAGYYNGTGFHDSLSKTYQVGHDGGTSVNFFVFDFHGVHGSVNTAQLRLFQPANGGSLGGNYRIFGGVGGLPLGSGFTTDFSTTDRIQANHAPGDPEGQFIFNALRGIPRNGVYGEMTGFAPGPATTLSTDLSDFAVSQINTALASQDTLVVCGWLGDVGDARIYGFEGSILGVGAQDLVLTGNNLSAAPEPNSVTLLLVLFCMGIGSRACRNRVRPKL